MMIGFQLGKCRLVFLEPRLELKDEDLEDEEFQLDKVLPNP